MLICINSIEQENYSKINTHFLIYVIIQNTILLFSFVLPYAFKRGTQL